MKLPRYLQKENHLSDNDWEVLYHLSRILTYFETVVKTLEGDGKVRSRREKYGRWSGSYGNVWDVVLAFEMLLNKLEEFKQLAEQFPDPKHFKIGINLAWQKLDEYYQKLDETPIYYTALALHPAYRWDWFEEVWRSKPSWISKAKSMVHEVWTTDYAHLDIRAISRSSDDEPRPRFPDPFVAINRLARLSRTSAIEGDEYAAWQLDRHLSDREVNDPIDYWFKKQERYPRLSQMALDFLTIQPMSAECERAFSAAGRMVTASRASLEASTIGMCQVLRSWYRAGVVDERDDSFAVAPLDMAKDEEDGLDWLQSDEEAYSEASDFEETNLPLFGYASDSE